MVELILLPAFDAWFEDLRDRVARKRITARLARLANGNPGDVRAVGEGVSELRIDHGPGYRVYFVGRGPTLVVVLGGGDKSTQGADIANASRPGEGLGHDLGGAAAMSDPDPNRPLDPGALARLHGVGRRFDPAAELETAEDVAIFLDEYLRDNADPAAFSQALGIVARAEGMTEIARRAGVGRESLYKSLSGDVTPSFETVLKVLTALGLRLAVAPGAGREAA